MAVVTTGLVVRVTSVGISSAAMAEGWNSAKCADKNGKSNY